MLSSQGVGLLGGQDPHAGRAHHDLEQLVESTGGGASFPRSVEQIGAVALEPARQIRTQYTIGYTPLNQALDGSYRTIRVTAKGSDPLTVRRGPAIGPSRYVLDGSPEGVFPSCRVQA